MSGLRRITSGAAGVALAMGLASGQGPDRRRRTRYVSSCRTTACRPGRSSRRWPRSSKANPDIAIQIEVVNWDVRWTDVELTAFEQAWNEVPAEQLAADPTFKQVADNYLAFRKVYKA